MIVSKEEYDEVQRLKKLSRIMPSDTQSMERLIRKYLDPRMVICRHCPAQIRMALKRLIAWSTTITVETVEEFEMADIEKVEVVVKKKPGRPCVKCKQKK